MELLTTVPLLIIDDLGMRKLPSTAPEELLEIVMRRYESGGGQTLQSVQFGSVSAPPSVS
jgi:DNA replication protein DnaC